jgi:galacturan 1,4-alpha-galacturonidase
MGLILAFVRVLFLMFLLVWYTDARASNGYKVFNVKKYGAVSNGKTENNKVINKSFINLIFLAISDNHDS